MAALSTTGTIDNPMTDDWTGCNAGYCHADSCEEAECAVCLEALYSCNNYRPVVTLRCAHPYHLDCIGSTFNAITARSIVTELRCPLCRSVQPTEIWQFVITRGLQESSRSGRGTPSRVHTSHDSSRRLENCCFLLPDIVGPCGCVCLQSKAIRLYVLLMGLVAVFLVFVLCFVIRTLYSKV
jgi:hypothetical protein